MRRYFTLVLMLLPMMGLLAQSPGGVSTGLVLWLKGDAGTSSTVDGAFLSSWNDQSGGGRNATQTTASGQPKLKKFAMNGNPAIETSSARFFNVPLTVLNNSRYTIFTVVKRASAGTSQYFFGAAQSAANGIYMGFRNDTRCRFTHNAATAESVCLPYDAATEVPRLVMMEHSGTANRALSEINSGTTVTATTTNTTNYPVTTQGRIGRGNTTGGFTGTIAEVIVYSRGLSVTEKRQVQSYLAIKYGITINNADNLFFNDATYANDVCGIGRNLTSQGLNQTTSSSESADDMVEISAASSLDDGDYLVIGNNNQATTWQLLATANCAVDSSMRRVWRVKETNDVGTVTLKFDLSKLTSPFSDQSVVLLVDRNNNGYADETPIQGTYSAPFMTFTNVQLENNYLFTLGTGRVTWYAVTNGNSNGAIWAKTATGTPQVVPSWCSRTDVVINPGVSLNINAAVTCKNLTIQPGSTITANTSNITVHGNITNNGIFNAGSSSVYLNGTTAQIISGTQLLQFNNLYCNNAAGITFSGSAMEMKGILQINTGTFNTGDKLTILSSATTQGSIGPILGDLTGTLIMQRYHNRTSAGWVNLASPIQNKTLQDWNDDLITSGFAGSDYPNYNFNNMYYYNESANGGRDNGWVGATNITNNIESGRGYYVYMNAGAMNLDVDGNIFKGPQTLTTSFTNTGTPADDGWNLVSNPYPSAINWLAGSWTKTNITNAVYVWNAATNQYASYVNGVATNGGSNIIPSSQSFFVFANAASPVLAVAENCKTSSQGTFKSMQETQALTLKVSDGQWSDEAVIEWNSIASAKFDSDADAYKMRSLADEVPYLAIADEENTDYSIQSLPYTNDEQIIDIKLQSLGRKSYDLTWEGLENFGADKEVILERIETGEIYRLGQMKKITVQSNGRDENANYRLHIKSKSPDASIEQDLTEVVTLTDNGVRVSFGYDTQREVKITAYNMVGQQLITPIVGTYENEVIQFGNRDQAALSIIEIIDLKTGERSVHRLGN
ncbi:MAG: hypothetical protein ACOVOO_10105 [Flavobacteriales bacterium]